MLQNPLDNKDDNTYSWILCISYFFHHLVTPSINCPNSRNNAEVLRGISIGTQILVMINATIWAIYAVLENSLWIGVPGIVNFPLALITIIIVRKSHKSPSIESSHNTGVAQSEASSV